MQKHNFGVTCPDMLSMETTTGSPGDEKECVDISYPGCTVIHYVTRISHRTQNHKFGVMCPDTIFMESALGLPDHEK
jgi:hypothetical protein